MTMWRNNRALRRQALTPIMTAHPIAGARTRGSAFGSNEAEARAGGAAGVVGAREARLGDEVVDVVCVAAVEGDEAGHWRDGAG